MSTFAECWDAASLDDTVQVSNGLPEPGNTAGVPWRIWRSHNFTGVLVQKSDASAPRRMRFELAPEAGAIVSYEVYEGAGHTFTITT